MIFRFIYWTVIFMIVGGCLLYFEVDIPYIMGWVGKLPGDLFLKRDQLVIYLPITSAALASLVWSFLLFAIFQKK